MSPYDEVYSRLEHIKELWRELQRTPRNSPPYEALVQKIRTESAGYLSLVDSEALTANSEPLTAGEGRTPTPRPPAKAR